MFDQYDAFCNNGISESNSLYSVYTNALVETAWIHIFLCKLIKLHSSALVTHQFRRTIVNSIWLSVRQANPFSKKILPIKTAAASFVWRWLSLSSTIRVYRNNQIIVFILKWFNLSNVIFASQEQALCRKFHLSTRQTGNLYVQCVWIGYNRFCIGKKEIKHRTSHATEVFIQCLKMLQNQKH